MSRTISEQLLEQFCLDLEIDCVRLRESTEPGVKSPDYTITVAGLTIAVEVKQFDPNAEEAEAAARLAAGQLAEFGGTPGSRVRGVLSVAAAQLKSRTKLEAPGLVVIFDNTGCLDNHLDSYHIKVGMYGLEQVILRQTPDGPDMSRFEDVTFGPKRKLTPDRNRAVSAIGKLQRYQGAVYVDFFHNLFAAVPLDPGILRAPSIRHFRLTEKVVGQGQDWEELA